MLTASLKTVHVTLSLQEGVVREPLYRKYLVLLAGNTLSNLKAGTPPTEESKERDKNVHSYYNMKWYIMEYTL